MTTNIIWAEPPAVVRVRKAKGKTQQFIEVLKTKPNTWAIYRHNAKHPYAPKMENVEWANRSNGDGTFTVYVRYVK